MKKHVLVVGFLLSISFTGAVQAQNKTLGVGVASPNPNAALHVESPTANQGFIMPRLTTAQRTDPGFVSALSVTDVGLMVFDIDMVQVFTWDGLQWDDTSVSANVTGTGSAGSFSVNNPGNTGAALYATTNGSGSPTSSAAILGETATAFSAITGIATGPGGSNAVSGMSSSSNAFSFGVYGSNTGMGSAGMFQVSNASNTSNALEANTNGTGGAAKFKVTNVSSVMPALWAETNSNQPLSAPIFGLNTGTGDVAASFRINNAASVQPALFVETNGTGRGAFIRRTSTTGSAPGLYVTSASGHGVWSDHNGATGYAGIFQNINTANPSAGIMAETIGTGPSIWAIKSTDAVGGDAFNALNDIATGRVAFFEMTSASNPQTAVQVNTAGTGSAGNFQINNAASTAPALFATTNGPGTGISADNTSTGDAIFALKTGSAGSAGNFQSNNASNGAATIFGMTNASAGTAIGLINSANGNAMAIFTGGMRVSSATVTTSTITTRAAAYFISSGGTTFSFSFPQAVADGEVFFIYNSTVSSITVDGASIPSNSGKTCIYLGGALRAL